MNVKHIFFDLDHTLWDFETNSAKTFEKIFRDNNINVSILVFLNYYKPINFEYWRLYRNEKISKEKLRYGRLKNTFDKMNFKISDTLIDNCRMIIFIICQILMSCLMELLRF